MRSRLAHTRRTAMPRTRDRAARVADNVRRLPITPVSQPDSPPASQHDGEPEYGESDPDQDLVESPEPDAHRPLSVDPSTTVEACRARAYDLSCQRPQWLWLVVQRDGAVAKGESARYDVVLVSPRAW